MSFLEDTQKRQRVSKACDNCRRKKVRCNGIKPTCSNCSLFTLNCTYLETSKKRGPPKGYIEAIENKLHRLEHLLDGLARTHPRTAESVLTELQKVEGLDDVRLRLADSIRPLEFHELRKRNQEVLKSVALKGNPGIHNTQSRGVRDLVMETLSGEANQLTLEDQGRVRYMGFSSGFYLLQSTEKYQDGLFRMKPLTQCPLDDKVTDPNPFVLPSPSVFEHLIDIYFQHINPIVPLLHQEQFTMSLKTNAQKPPLFLLNAMFALAANLSSKIQWLEEERARSEIFYKRAKKLLDQSYDVTSLENVQALVLLSHYFHITHGSMKSWVYSGMAIRLAEDLGLHRNSDKWQIKALSDSLKEARKRAWWSCYVMDRSASACMGRPLCIDDRHCDTSLPQAHNNPLNKESKEYYEKMGPGARMDIFVEVIKLHEIFGRIMNNVYAIRAHPTQNPFESEAFLLDLDAALHRWLVELPPDLHYRPQEFFNGKKPASNVIVYLHVLYHNALILLHRPYIPNPCSKVCTSPYPSLQICTTSANSITAITHMCSGESGLDEVLIFVLFPIFTAATVHLTNLTAKDAQLRNLAKKNLVKNMNLLGKIRNRWGSAGKYYIVIRELLIARNIDIDGMVSQDSSHSTLGQNSNYCRDKTNNTLITQPKDQKRSSADSLQKEQIAWLNGTNYPTSATIHLVDTTPDDNYLNQQHIINDTTTKEPVVAQANLYHQISPVEFPQNAGFLHASGNLDPSAPRTTFETITNVDFDPSAPSNTLSEMTVNNQHFINQFDNTNGAPIWNVPLSFDFDEWNDYVGQYSRNISPPITINNNGQSVPPIQSPFISSKKEIEITGHSGELMPCDLTLFSTPEIGNYQPIPQATATLKDRTSAQVQPWQF